LNNLAQADVFTADRLAAIAQQLDAMELEVYAQNNEGGRNSKDYQNRLREGSAHVDAAGNFSIEVLKAALQTEFGLPLPHLSQRGDGDIAAMQGFLCHKSDHWFAIRLIGGRYWNLNSMLERPVAISHFTLATEMDQWQNQGYTVFCVATGLPVGGNKHPIHNRHAQWHRMSDLLRGKSTGDDPWEKLNGAGMRLDGRGAAASAIDNSAMVVEGLTEEEMLQFAMQASIEPQSVPRVVTESGIDVPPEPAAGTEGAVRIQFRMPDGNKRVVRRFLETDSVATIYAFVEQESGGRPVDLLYGFPPKDLMGLLGLTVREANLANESIQGRFL
jgi:Ataxin-3